MTKKLYMKKLTITASVFATGLFLATAISHAQTYSSNCQPIYGGGETCIQIGKVLIDKKVLHPTTNTTKGGNTNQFVDNLGINDPKYAPEQMVTFTLTITNTGNSAVTNVKVEDTLPQYVTKITGKGTFDSNTRIYAETIDKLEANESKTITLMATVVSASQLPAEQGITCVVNQVRATAGNSTSEDNAQFCIEKTVLTAKDVPFETKGGLKVYPPVTSKQTPPTGPEMWALVGLIPSGLAGFALRKKAK